MSEQSAAARRPPLTMPPAETVGLRTAAGDAPDGDAPPCLALAWDGTRTAVQGTVSCTLGDVTAVANWHWDGRRLEARTDRLGFRPLFYAVDGARLWISPSIPELLRRGVPAELDDAALAVFLRLGTFLADDTPFLRVRALPPAARLTWEEGRLQVAGRRAESPRLEIGRRAAIDRYAEAFRAAVAKHDDDPEEMLVPLSGGRDSRHILLELHAAGRAPAGTVTVRPAPPKSDADVRVAARLAAALGVPHTVLDTTDDRCGDEVEKNLRTSLCVFEHFWVMPLVRHLTGRGLVIWDGIGGDTLSEARYMNARRLALFRAGDLRRYAEEELLPEAYLPKLLQPDVYRRCARALAVERLEAELHTHVDAPNPLGSYRFWNRTRRTVALAPFGLLAPVATVRAPFLDPDVFDFLASLPGEMLLDRRFHTDTIARAYPQFATIPYEDDGAPPARGSAYARRFGAAALTAEVRHVVRAWRARHAAVGPTLLRHGAYAARLAALLVAPKRALNVGWVAHLGLYLSLVERVARRL